MPGVLDTLALMSAKAWNFCGVPVGSMQVSFKSTKGSTSLFHRSEFSKDSRSYPRAIALPLVNSHSVVDHPIEDRTMSVTCCNVLRNAHLIRGRAEGATYSSSVLHEWVSD